MWNVPRKERLDRIPRLYDTEHVPFKEKQVFLHFFIGGCDWYVCEFQDDMFFGYSILNGDLHNAEWGLFSFSELKEISIGGIEIDCELEEYFPVKRAIEIDKICKGMLWGKYEKPRTNTLALLTQAENQNMIELPCSECGTTLNCEPDATEAYCFDCDKVLLTHNPLVANGLI